MHGVAFLALSVAAILIASLLEALASAESAKASQVNSLGILLIQLVQHICDVGNLVANLPRFRPKPRYNLQKQLLNFRIVYILQVLLVLEELLLVWVHLHATALVLILEFIIATLLTIIVHIITPVAMLIGLILLIIILILPLLLVVLPAILSLRLSVPGSVVMVVTVFGAFWLVYGVILLPVLLLVGPGSISRRVVRLVCGRKL